MKVAIYAEVMRQARLGLVDLDATVVTTADDLVGGSGVLLGSPAWPALHGR